MLAMGLCLMWDGYSNISEASKVSKSPVVLVLAGHDGRLPVPASLQESSLGKREFVLEDYTRTKDEAQHLATLVNQADLSPPVIVEIADRRPRDLPLDFSAHHNISPDVDVWTIDGTPSR